MTLLHLVSDQTLQNLLPILALGPKRVIQIRTSPGKFKEKSEHLEIAVREAGLQSIDFKEVVIEPPTPGIGETLAVIEPLLIERREDLGFNFTGGTKLMSIAAYRLAERYHIPSLYVDTQARAFIDGETGEWPLLPSFKKAFRGLNVPLVLAAHGLDPEAYKETNYKNDHLEFGAFSLALHEKHHAHLVAYLEKLRKIFLPNGKFLKKGKLKEALRQPLPEFNSLPGVKAYLEEAVKIGVVRKVESDYFLEPNPESGMNAIKLKQNANEHFKILEGVWFEFAVLDQMKKSGRFGDLRSGVKSEGGSESAAIGENDIIGLDKENFRLTFVSCKSGSANLKPLEHISALSRRAQEYGGTYCEAVLSVYETQNAQNKQNIRDFCHALKVKPVIGPGELKKWLDSPS